MSPWSRRTVAHFDGTLTGRERFERQYVSTPLDGTLSVALLSPKGADFDLYLLGRRGNGWIRRSVTSRRIDRLSYTICGTRAHRVEVFRYDGTGRFKTDIVRP